MEKKICDRKSEGGDIVEVMVNGEKIKLFEGAKVKNALRQYSQEEYRLVIEGEKTVKDGDGNRVGLEGALREGSKLRVETMENS